MRKSYLHILIILLITNYGCKESTTPNEFLNKQKVDLEKYNSDKHLLQGLTQKWYDSIRSVSRSPKGKLLEVFIDTIFYGPETKMTYLTILKRENKQVLEEEKASYIACCFITSNSTINKQLKYSSTSSGLNGFIEVKKSIREIYLSELNYIEGEYNINDERFWDSDVWTVD